MLLRAGRVELVLQSPVEVLAWVDSLPPEVRFEVSPVWLERLKKAIGPDPWTCMFRIRLNDEGSEIGSCGFKGAPDENGVVEIAYGIDELYRNRGYATESAGALTKYALNLEEVRTVRANTKAENFASERTVAKCGFILVGQFEDPEDGWVNRWEINSPEKTIA
jgi:[ribosomal protein S5]-alanine N-acetyltransferase